MYRPEVGEECLACVDDGDWHKGTLRYMSSYTVVFESFDLLESIYGKTTDDPEWSGHTEYIKFRPLKSKRDEEIEEMASILYEDDSKEGYCSELYDAGYRKQMPYAEFVQIITDYLYDNFTDYDNAMSDAAELAAKLNRTPEGN